MGFGKARTTANRQGDRRREREATKPPELEDDGPIPDLWDIPGVRLPGSPKTGRNNPMDVLLLNVSGTRVCFARKNKQHFRNTGTQPAVWWLWRPTKAPELWSGPRHHALTHALRLLQAVSFKREGHNLKPHESIIRGGINPQRLLEECGASKSHADSLVSLLCEHDLLHEREVDGKAMWLASTRFRGVGPAYELYTAQDIPEFILPEFMETLQAEPTTSEGSKMTEGDDTATDQQPLLMRVYDRLVSYGEQPAALEVQDGWLKFVIPGNLDEILADALSSTPYQITKQLNLLRTELKLYRTSSGGRGKPFFRFVKLHASEAVAVAAETAGKKAAPARTASPAEPPPGEQPEGVPVSEEDFGQLITRMGDKLDEYHARIGELEQELHQEREAHARTTHSLETEREAHATTKQELETAKAAKPTFIIPERVAKHLE